MHYTHCADGETEAPERDGVSQGLTVQPASISLMPFTTCQSPNTPLSPAPGQAGASQGTPEPTQTPPWTSSCWCHSLRDLQWHLWPRGQIQAGCEGPSPQGPSSLPRAGPLHCTALHTRPHPPPRLGPRRSLHPRALPDISAADSDTPPQGSHRSSGLGATSASAAHFGPTVRVVT